jgi:ABC-2 type transport system ATP-binding protein
MMGKGDAVVGLDEVTKTFKAAGHEIEALKSVSMRVERGSITGLVGPDGAGKTTLMRLVAGLLVPDSGRVSVLGMDATRQYLSVQASLGYMPQRFGLYEDLSVQENLNLYADLQGVPYAKRPVRIGELLHMTGLQPFTARLSGRLSGGMKQKLGLACTLLRSPELLLLDEATVGIDPVSRRELWSIINRLVREEGASVLLSTAYLDEAERCDAVAMLHDGHILGQGPPSEFSERMKGHTYAVTAEGMKSRSLQEKLFNRPGVIDAVVQGGGVRLVVESAAAPEAERLLPSVGKLALYPVPPRFEDSFVSMMRDRRDKAGLDRPAEAERTGTNGHVAADERVIDVKDLKRRFGDFYAVRGVTFSVMRGEVFGLLGANGAGKSTTFRMLCGLLPASGGSIRVAGVDLRRAAASARARVGYMSQKFSLYGNLSVLENLKFFSSAYNLTGNRRERRIHWALEQFSLSGMAGVTSITLPLGFKQRLAMACALMHEPEILFLDEPTSGVDPLARREFWLRINALAERGVTILVTTHFMEEAEYCDRLAIMATGEILALGPPAEIKDRVRSEKIPSPTIEDAFISFIEGYERKGVP